jgi:small basic protein
MLQSCLGGLCILASSSALLGHVTSLLENKYLHLNVLLFLFCTCFFFCLHFVEDALALDIWLSPDCITLVVLVNQLEPVISFIPHIMETHHCWCSHSQHSAI